MCIVVYSLLWLSKPHMVHTLTQSSCTSIELTIRLHVFPETVHVMLLVLSRNTADPVHHLLIWSVQPWLQSTAGSLHHLLFQSAQPWLQSNHESRKTHRLIESFLPCICHISCRRLIQACMSLEVMLVLLSLPLTKCHVQHAGAIWSD